MVTPRQLAELFKQGKNISALLRNEKGVERNTTEIIETAYDLQTGSYIELVGVGEMALRQDECSREIARVIASLTTPKSILEAGVGEGTTISGVIKHLAGQVESYGFDLSWSRVAFAKKWLMSKGVGNTVLCTGNLLDIPFIDNSIDVVYTSHSIEPNGGREVEILSELYRVAKKFVVLIEPGYEYASEEARQRMDFHGYCKGLNHVSLSLGYDVIEHKPFTFTISDPLNPSAITIIRKGTNQQPVPNDVLACPKYKTPLRNIGGMLYSREALAVYPVIGGIPCLRVENGVIASKYEEYVETHCTSIDRFPQERKELL